MSASEEAQDDVAVDSDAGRQRRVVLVAARKVHLWVGGAAWLGENVGQPEGALAEPVAEHGDITAGEVDDAPFGGDEPRPRQMDSVVLVGDRSPVRHDMPADRLPDRSLIGGREERGDVAVVLVDAGQLPARMW